MIRSLVVSMVLGVLISTPTVFAQSPFPPRVADSIATCMTGNLSDLLSESASTEQRPDGWRVLIPMAGRPFEPGAQTQSPTDDTLAWLDLKLYPNIDEVPGDVNNFDSFAVVTATGGAMAVYLDGYFMLPIRSAAESCVVSTTGGRFAPR